GVLGAHTLKQRDFSHDDINFVLSIANTLAEFIRQRQAAVALQEANTLLEQRVAERTEELKEANFVLKEQETFLRSIYNEVGLAVYVVDVRDGFKHLDVNPGFIEMTKVDRERVVGKRPHELEHLPEENREMMLASYQQVVQTKRALAYEIMSPDPAGETWWLVTLNPVLDDSGEVYRIIGTGLSITSRVQAEQEIREQKEFIELLINSSLDGIMAFDTELKYTLWNNGMQRISGIAPEEAIGKVSYEVFPFLKESGELEQFKKTLQGQIVTSHDQYYEVPKTNHQGFFEAHYTPLKTGEDNVIGGLGIIRETSERKRALDRLRSSEERFRTIFDQGTSAACLLILEDWLIIDVNQKCENILGYKRGDLRGKDLRQLKLWQNPAELIALEKLIETENTKRDQDLHILRDKEDGILCASVELINYSGQDHLLLIFEDISEQRRNEAELREMRLKLLEMEEKERLELARELHDGVIQQLLGFNQALSQMEKDIKASKGQTPINVKSYHESAQELVDQLRRTIIDLRPPGLEEFGLKASLEGFLTYLNSQEIKGSPHLSWQLDETDSIPLDISRVLFRTAQEALRNALSHASAKELHLELSIESNNIYLTITDDGKGFTLPERLSKFAQENHFGLLGMEERLELFNGSLKLESELGKGTTLKVSLPLEARGA
ncbi:MAG: PAS domain S-box protein, partial [Trueperaceae bacterium]|nr:PAS domain S-box protein [Trueperaceae bacterium]